MNNLNRRGPEPRSRDYPDSTKIYEHAKESNLKKQIAAIKAKTGEKKPVVGFLKDGGMLKGTSEKFHMTKEQSDAINKKVDNEHNGRKTN